MRSVTYISNIHSSIFFIGQQLLSIRAIIKALQLFAVKDLFIKFALLRKLLHITLILLNI